MQQRKFNYLESLKETRQGKTLLGIYNPEENYKMH